MELSELLSKHREAYLTFFAIQKSECEGASEVLLEMKNDDQEEIFRLYRFDCLGKNEDGSFKISEFNNDTYLNHPAVDFEYNGLIVEVNPFFWNGCEIHFKDKNYNFDAYIDWAKKWIDIDDENKNNAETEFAELIHNVQPPELTNGKCTLAIDFGTAKTESFMELLIILKEIGVTKITIASKSMLEE